MGLEDERASGRGWRQVASIETVELRDSILALLLVCGKWGDPHTLVERRVREGMPGDGF